MPTFATVATNRGSAADASAFHADDAELVRRARGGDADCFARLYETRFGHVSRYIAAIVGDQDAAEDVAAQTFIRAWQRLHTLRDVARFDHWLFRIAHNEAISALRRLRDTRPLAAEDDQPDPSLLDAPADALDRSDRVALVRRALVDLPEAQREVIVLRFLRDLPHAEVARQTGRTEQAVRALQYRAFRRLRRALNQDDARW